LTDGFPFGKKPIPESRYREYAGRSVLALNRRLKSGTVDEGDLFAIALLATPIHIIGPTEFITHMKGFLALLKHVSQDAESNRERYPLQMLWPFVRDELILFGYEYLSPGNYDRITEDEMFCCLTQASLDTGSIKGFQERQEYQGLLGGPGTTYRNSKKALHVASTKQLVMLKTALALKNQNRPRLYCGEQDRPISSIVADVRTNLLPIDEERMLELIVQEMTEVGDRGERNPTALVEPQPLVGILRVLLCRLLIVAIEASSIPQGLESTKGIAAANALISFVVRVYAIAFRSRSRDIAGACMDSSRAENVLLVKYERSRSDIQISDI
jgi:hypothetical protein